MIGSFVGAMLGSFLYNGPNAGGDWSWGLDIAECFALQALLPLATLIPLMPFMYEIQLPKEATLRSSMDIWREMYDFVSLDGVCVPMMYLYVRA